MPSAIHAENISRTFSRGKIRALQDFSLDVETGIIFGLLGPNGAGKTTFIKILLGLTRPSSGSATLFGVPTERYHARNRIGYLPENHRFPLFLTGSQFLDYCGRLSGMHSKAEREKRAELLLKRVNMWQWRNTRIKKYSKGMMQRLGLAQALIHDPDLIFLDEPTDGIDPIGRKEVRDLLLELKNSGKTIFLNSHLLSEVETICDQVAILNKGKLVSQGSVHELTTSDRRFQLYIEGTPQQIEPVLKEHTQSVIARNDHYEITVRDSKALNAAIDSLRQQGLLIEAIIPHKQSLEDSFFQAVRGHSETDLNTLFETKAKTGANDAD